MICHRCRGITFIIPPVYPPTTGGVNDYGRTQGKHFCKNSPRDYSCDGRDMSPEIDIGGVNAKITKSHAILVNHPDSPGWWICSLDCVEYGAGHEDPGKNPQDSGRYLSI